jgi:hypothetical protein
MIFAVEVAKDQREEEISGEIHIYGRGPGPYAPDPVFASTPAKAEVDAARIGSSSSSRSAAIRNALP